MAARVAAIRRFLADSGQELHEVHRSRTPEGSRRNLPLLGHRLGRDRVAGNDWKVRLLKSLSRRWVKSAITNQSRLTACDQIERPGMEGTSVTSTRVFRQISQRGFCTVSSIVGGKAGNGRGASSSHGRS